MMVHDNLAEAADQLAAIAEHETEVRRQTLRCIMELAEQCPPGATVSADALAGALSMILGD